MTDAPAGARSERPARGQLRPALIAESFALLAEAGMAGFSVAELARRLGVSTAAPYRHFPTRDALLAVVAAQAADELTRTMESAAHAAGTDPLDRLAAIAGAYVRHVRDRGAGLDVIFARELRPLRDADLARAGRDLMTLLLDLAREAGHADPSDALLVLEQLFVLAHGYVTLDAEDFLTGARHTGEDIATRATRAATALLRGSVAP
ncbi:TetR family transcriptional regulator [Streptomyces sp. SID5785]|uniref:TetR family transcriptional regulator n=1 Tax=Streptomyces sp. SID5785 TaxID=2690309 RepID=UPI001360E964|nr:TetR family transcriptional regulator [Streptomyces sp. SID5785]